MAFQDWLTTTPPHADGLQVCVDEWLDLRAHCAPYVVERFRATWSRLPHM
eukprot:SAG11_NODE_23458_length_388_cov_0.892734_1_plen_49_part_10